MAEAEVVLDASAYSGDAIQRAAYKLQDEFTLELTLEADRYRCLLHFAEAVSDEAVAEFRRDALDQALRERIREETEPVRNLVLALAFSKTDLMSDA